MLLRNIFDLCYKDKDLIRIKRPTAPLITIFTLDYTLFDKYRRVKIIVIEVKHTSSAKLFYKFV